MPAPRKKRAKTTIGWEEWCALPALGLPAIKVKIDTGAKTSAIHAFDIEEFVKDDILHVRFKIHPIKGNRKLERVCEAPMVGQRTIISSNGEREKRYVITTTIQLGDIAIKAEITLTSRTKMAFRMLLGREAMRKGKIVVDPAKSYLLGKVKNVKELYGA